MKKLILFLVATVLFTACDKEKGDGRLDPNAMISLRAAKIPKAAAEADTRNLEHLSPLEIVQQTEEIVFINKDIYPNSPETSRGFGDNQRDYENERLLMWGVDILNPETGELRYEFIGGADIVLVRHLPADEHYPELHRDTIAYIPNATLRDAKTTIKAAYDRQDYETVYKLFDEAFTFIPITGAEWRALKETGDN